MSRNFILPKEFAGINLEKNQSSIEIESNELSNIPKSNLKNCIDKQLLPIENFRRKILYSLTKSRILFVCGETGCGKSTQLPQYIYESGLCSNKKLVVCLPSTIAVVNICSRIAEERSWSIGKEIGYKTRFNINTSGHVFIEFISQDMMIKELLHDFNFEKISCIMVDEAHNPSFENELILFIMKRALNTNPSLKLIISSASLNIQNIKEYYLKIFNSNDIKEININKDIYPVEIFHTTRPVNNYVEKSFDILLELHNKESLTSGDILIFLPSVFDIDHLSQKINQLYKNIKYKIDVKILHSGINMKDQLKVFDISNSRNTRKVVISTSIGETSITIPNIGFVIDCGLKIIRYLDYELGLELLTKVQISKTSAKQRAGRAGRTRPGKVYRLYTEENFQKMNENEPNELQTSLLVKFILISKLFGLQSLKGFHILSMPKQENLEFSMEVMHAMKIIDDNGTLIRSKAWAIFNFPLHPFYSKLILDSVENECVQEGINLAALGTLKSIFIESKIPKNNSEHPIKKFSVYEGDHLTYLNIFTIFKETSNKEGFCGKYMLNLKSLEHGIKIAKQLMYIFLSLNLESKPSNAKIDSSSILKCLCSAFILNTAQRSADGTYKLLRSRSIILYLHPSSVLFGLKPPEFVVFTNLVHTDKLYMKDVSAVKKEWIIEAGENIFSHKVLY